MAKDQDEIRQHEVLIALDKWEFIRIGSRYRGDYKNIWLPFLNKIKNFRLKKVDGRIVKIKPIDDREFQKVSSHFWNQYGIVEPVWPGICAFNRKGEINEQNIKVICNAFADIPVIRHEDYLGFGGEVLFKKNHRKVTKNKESFFIGRVTAQDMRELKTLKVSVDKTMSKERIDYHNRRLISQWKILINRQNELKRDEKAGVRTILKKHQDKMRIFLRRHKTEIRYRFRDHAEYRRAYRIVERIKRMKKYRGTESAVTIATLYLNPGVSVSSRTWINCFDDTCRKYRMGCRYIGGDYMSIK